MVQPDQPSKKPLVYYCAIVTIVMMLLNALVFPAVLQRQVEGLGGVASEVTDQPQVVEGDAHGRVHRQRRGVLHLEVAGAALEPAVAERPGAPHTADAELAVEVGAGRHVEAHHDGADLAEQAERRVARPAHHEGDGHHAGRAPHGRDA